MSKNSSLIQINSHLYDANSGRLYHHPRGPVIDGFRRQPARVIKKFSTTLSVSKEDSINRSHKSAHSIHSRAQRSKTLMRKAVGKPAQRSGREKLDQLKRQVNGSNKDRVIRAMNVVKNPRVDRFGKPINQTKSLLAHAATRAKPNAAQVGGFNIKSHSGGSMAIQQPPSMVSSVSHQKLERMLDEALLRADAHKKAVRNKRLSKRHFGGLNFMPKWLAIALIGVVLAAAGTYFAWRNIPAVSLKIASLRSQVQGSLPEYIPSGFRFNGPIEYKSGNISLTYRADSDRYFTLEQQASNWDSSSLVANALPQDTKVQTSQVKGATVYVDSSSNEATWVSNGKRYTLKGKLDTDEIFKIADSIL